MNSFETGVPDSTGRIIRRDDTLLYFNPRTNHREHHTLAPSHRYGNRLAIVNERGEVVGGFATMYPDGSARRYGSKKKNRGHWKARRWTIVTRRAS